MDTLPTLVNLHIPRTAGRSRSAFLARVVGDGEVFYTMGPDKREFSEYRSLAPAEKRNIRLVTGHMSFAFMRSIADPKFCITFVRNPLHRTLSHYNSYKRWERHPIGRAINDNDMSLADFLYTEFENRQGLYDNAMVRFLLEDPPPFMQMTEDYLEEAKENLCEHIHFVGVTEMMEESLLALGKSLGLRDMPPVSHVGRMAYDKKMSGLNPRDMQAMMVTNQYDIELYSFVAERFQATLQRLH